MIEVDEDTGKVMLEYIHGGLEWVEPDIIQEALLARGNNNSADNLYSFTKVLNH